MENVESIKYESGYMINAKQLKAARVFLDWDQKRLAAESGVSLPTIQRMETIGPERSSAANVNRVQKALEAGGVRFGPDGCVCPVECVTG